MAVLESPAPGIVTVPPAVAGMTVSVAMPPLKVSRPVWLEFPPTTRLPGTVTMSLAPPSTRSEPMAGLMASVLMDAAFRLLMLKLGAMAVEKYTPVAVKFATVTSGEGAPEPS